MKAIYIGILLFSIGLIEGCMQVSAKEVTRYQLSNTAHIKKVANKHHDSILVMQPSAMPGYDTDQMIYITKPYQINVFAENAWTNPPAVLLFPLIASSLESSHYFYAVALDPNVSKTDYRLESKLIRLQQNFLMKPSQLELVMQIILIRTGDNRVLATNTIYERMPCSSDSPFGGVMAANQAASKLTRRITDFVIDQIEHQLSK